MAGSVNKVILIGNLGADPEMKATTSGVQIARLRIATTEHWTDRSSGQKQEKTEWHTVVAFDKLAGICERFMKKGGQVYIEGQLTTRSWDDKETGAKRYSTEIKAREITMLGRAERGEAPSGVALPDEKDDEVPFGG